MNRRTLALLTLALLLSGCASGPRCISDDNYRDAGTLVTPPATATGNLKLPESAAALRIPPQPATPSVPGPGLDCLDSPPRLAEQPEEAEAAKPADKPAKVEQPKT